MPIFVPSMHRGVSVPVELCLHQLIYYFFLIIMAQWHFSPLLQQKAEVSFEMDAISVKSYWSPRIAQFEKQNHTKHFSSKFPVLELL